MSETTETTTLDDATMEDLHNIPLDHEADAKAARDSQYPAGWYTTLPPVDMGVLRKTEDGRPYFIARLVLVNEKDGSEARVEVFFSHVRKNKDDGTPDRMTQTYLQLKEVYRDATGAAPATLGELLDYLANYGFRVRLTKGRTSNFVAGFAKAK